MKVKISSFCCCSATISSVPGFIIFLFDFHIHQLVSAQFRVIGPDQPVTAIVGEDIVLPCHLSPRMSAENMEVIWFQSQLSQFVHRYSDGKDQTEDQTPEYQGRTVFLRDSIANGSVSLRIHNIRPSDEGQYRCFVQSLTFYNEATLELKVAALGSDPQLSVEGYQNGGIRVVCQSIGWYPEPQVLWRDPSGQHLPSLSETSRVDDDLFEAQTTVIIRENSNQKLSCCVWNSHFNQEKESTIYVSDVFFPKVSLWIVALCVILVVLFVCIGLVVYLFKMKETLAAELRWRRVLTHSVNVTLDPDTAHPQLLLSEGQKSVRRGDKWHRLPNNPKRFDTLECVLGCEGFTSGRYYWEVQVGGEIIWAVGVARESVRRKGLFCFNPEWGIWAMEQWWGEFQALTSPKTPLPLSWVPRRIRVCLDYEQGLVTFLDADNDAPIFTFPPASFSGERIHPWLWVQSEQSQLRLCP
ncbi:unnamed protein product [Natator depressus]